MKILKKADRILLEMCTGMFLSGIVFEGIAVWFVKDKLFFSASLWFGVVLAMLGCKHMAVTLDRGLAAGADASKIITAGYVVRYIALGVILALTAVTGVLDTVFVFVGYMSLKVTAYLQPLTHKFFNKLFHETDPVATPMPEEEAESVSVEGDEPSDGE